MVTTYLKKIDNIENLMTKEHYQEVLEKIQDLKQSIIYDIAIKNSKGNEKDQLKNAKDLLKNSKKVNEKRPLFHKIYKIDDTFQMCDGYTAVVLKNMIDGLELNNAPSGYLDCRKVINNCNHTGYDYEEVKIDMLELEQQAIKVKSIKEPPYPLNCLIHINNSYFNPTYLLRAIKILGTDTIIAKVHKTSEREPIYLKSDSGEAIVLPIRQPKDKN